MRIGKIVLSCWIISALLIVSTGCDDDKKVLEPIEEEEALFTWLWALDDGEGKIRVYDADTGDLKVTFDGVSHVMMRQAYAGPSDEPTVWMGKDGTAYGFTRGFHAHGDHGHMELPEEVGSVATGAGNVHQGVGSHGDYVVYANDGDQTFTVINVDDLSTRTVHHGSSHSAALYAHGHIAATDMHNKWARIIDVGTDAVIAEVPIDTLAHGDAYHHDSEKAFIATLNGFEVIDAETGDKGAFIPYPTSGRVNFLYHAGENPVAFGPHKSDGGTDKIFLLRMDTRTAEALTVPGADLNWNISGGNFALSADGSTVVASDLSSSEAYVICIDPSLGCYKTVSTLEVASSDMAVAINHDGDHVWLMNKATGDVYCYHPDDGELHNQWSVDASTDYIFVTSYDGEVMKDY